MVLYGGMFNTFTLITAAGDDIVILSKVCVTRNGRLSVSYENCIDLVIVSLLSVGPHNPVIRANLKQKYTMTITVVSNTSQIGCQK